MIYEEFQVHLHHLIHCPMVQEMKWVLLKVYEQIHGYLSIDRISQVHLVSRKGATPPKPIINRFRITKFHGNDDMIY